MAKPAGAACNMACHYCYYSKPKQAPMDLQTLEMFVQQYIAMQTTGHVLFTWHGGEPMLRPLSFYRKAIELQRKYADGRHIENCIQTNGTLLTPEWCQFLHDNQWLVGISIDGTQEMHDTFRKASWSLVMNSIRMMQHYGVEWNAMATVHSANASKPIEFYRFFKSIGCRYLQFTPIVESNGQDVLPMAVKPDEWGDFLCAIFDEWVQHDVGEVFVQIFDATLANWLGVTPGLCILAAECGHAGVIEANGDVYSCDHFVFPEHRLGNIRQHTLIDMMYGEQQSRFAAKKSLGLPHACQQCQWFFACHGECPKNWIENRGVRSEELGVRSEENRSKETASYLCSGYRQYFAHVAPKMDIMADLYRHGKAPAEIMEKLRG